MTGDRPSEPRPLSDGLDRVLRSLGAPPVAAMAEVHRQWPLVVGADVAAHTRPRVTEGRLVVDVDHPAWASRVRFVEARILEWLTELMGEGAPSRVEVRVQPAGTHVHPPPEFPG